MAHPHCAGAVEARVLSGVGDESENLAGFGVDDAFDADSIFFHGARHTTTLAHMHRLAAALRGEMLRLAP